MNNHLSQLDKILRESLDEINSTEDRHSLETLKTSILGRKGSISKILSTLKDLNAIERPLVGSKANQVKEEIELQLNHKIGMLRFKGIQTKILNETIDVTAPSTYNPPGHRHPIVKTTEDIVDIFTGLGYRLISGPEIETDFYNFTALNIPEDHPARDMQDTFYLKGSEKLLRTHTSPVQIHHLEDYSPPVRVIAPGRVYRRDSVDATHSPVFHQIEVLAIDRNLDFGHLKGTVEAFLKAFFGDLKVRFRASYFPFTEPSVEVDVLWKNKWLEVMGCGMVDPNVMQNLNLDNKNWSGFAMGLGVERFCMVRHNIDDIRRLYTSDLRFLEQF